MSYDRKGKAPQKRHISPEAGESSSKRPASRAFEDMQVVQVTEGFHNLGILETSHSQAQNYGLPLATSSNYHSTAETADPIFSPEADSCIISTVALQWTFDQIKNEFFPHQHNVTPRLLQYRAQTLGAFWTQQEDKRLSEMELRQREPREVLEPIRDQLFSNPRRDIWDIQGRYNLLKGWPTPRPGATYAQAGESSQAQQYSVFNDQSSSPEYTENHPNYTSAGQPSSQPAAVTQAPATSNTSSAPSYGSIQEAHQPIPPNEPGYPKQRNHRPKHVVDEAARTRADLKANLPAIKRNIAQGWSWQKINETYCPRYHINPMRRFLIRQGCYLWSFHQTQQLLGLRTEGNNWAQVCDRLMSPRRTQQEAEARYEWFINRPWVSTSVEQ